MHQCRASKYIYNIDGCITDQPSIWSSNPVWFLPDADRAGIKKLHVICLAYKRSGTKPGEIEKNAPIRLGEPRQYGERKS